MFILLTRISNVTFNPQLVLFDRLPIYIYIYIYIYISYLEQNCELYIIYFSVSDILYIYQITLF